MKDEKTFNGVIKAMEETESDKDRFLKAARLERHERDKRYEMDRLVTILNYLLASIAMIGGFAVAFFFLYMVTK